MTSKSGGCLCEKIRYTISSSPISQGICYCRQCQKTGGVYGSPLIVLRRDAFKFSLATLSIFKTTSSRGSVVTRNFCKHCGSHIFAQISDVTELITLRVATLDDASFFVPEYLVWTKSAGTACALPKDVPSYSENAPLDMILGFGGAEII